MWKSSRSEENKNVVTNLMRQWGHCLHKEKCNIVKALWNALRGRHKYGATTRNAARRCSMITHLTRNSLSRVRVHSESSNFLKLHLMWAQVNLPRGSGQSAWIALDKREFEHFWYYHFLSGPWKFFYCEVTKCAWNVWLGINLSKKLIKLWFILITKDKDRFSNS